MGRWNSAWIDRIGLCVLCAVHFAVACHASAHSTPTVDEFSHLPAALVYVQERTFCVYPHNPPLPKVVAGLVARTQQPLTAESLSLVRHRPPGSPWHLNIPNHLLLGEVFEIENTQSPEATSRYFQTFAWGRRAIALWSAMTIPVLFLWGRWWFGRGAGWTGAMLWAACPTVIAHAGLITSDVPAASLSLIAAFLFARWLHGTTGPGSGSRGRALLAGLALGAALLTKFSVVLLIPVFLVWSIGRAGTAQGLTDFRRTRGLVLFRTAKSRQFVLILAAALFTVNAGYLFEGTGLALDRFEFASQSLTRPRRAGDPRCEDAQVKAMAPSRINRFKGSLLGMFPSPVPAMYLVGFDRLKWEAEGKYDHYLRGEWRRQGYWDYYLYGLGVKWPIGTWAILALAILMAFLGQRIPDSTGATLLPWLVLAGLPLLVLSILQDVNLGLRYALPAFPFLFLVAGTAARHGAPTWIRAAVLVAVLANIVSVARVHPHELSYFNEAAGGPERGRFHLIDSNLDWGQDLTRLADWVHRTPQWKDVRLAYWGTVSPELVGIDPYRLAPRDKSNVPVALRLRAEHEPGADAPQPGKYAVSVNFERGMSFRTPLPRTLQPSLPPGFRGRHGLTMLVVPRNAYTWFQHFSPVITPEVGYSILLYDLSLEEVNRVRATLGMPLLPDGNP